MCNARCTAPAVNELLAAGALLLIELIVTWMAWAHVFTAALVIHVAGLCAAGLLVYRSVRNGSGVRIPGLVLIGTAGAGVFGSAGALIALCVMKVSRTEGGSAEWFAALFPQSAQHDLEVSASSARRATSGEFDGEVLPLVDLLESGDEFQKQAVVALVARSFRPSLAPLLERALQDASNAVRVQAATALARIEGEFLEREVELRREFEEAFGGDDGCTLKLARLLDDYAFTGLLDPEREQQNRTEALNLYLQYLIRRPEDAAVRTAVARLLIRRGDYQAAEPWLETVGSGDAGTGEESTQGTMWRMEIAFRLGRWEELHHLAEVHAGRLEQEMESAPALRDVIALWQGASR
ncbi:MAG: hypothetical protein IT168_12265 [Bryobacterales bacterium]|nr:hypothetical protein [Bryobacterales bacterium]